MNTSFEIICRFGMNRNLCRIFGKIIVCSFVIFTYGTFAVQAQKPLEHEQRIFRSADNKLFINKNLPLYIRVASSPEDEADSWLLESSKTREYANPMYLDTEGLNTLRSPSAVDTATKKTVYPLKDIIFDVFADGEAPVSKLIYGQSTVYKKDDIFFFANDMDLKFDASDQISGIDDVFYSINGNDYISSQKHPLDIKDEGNYNLKFYAVDNVGNVETLNVLNFVVDVTPPVTSHQINGINKDNILAHDATITLSARDSLSGVARVFYAIDDGGYVVYNKPIPVSLLNDGESKIAYYSEDQVGNKEEIQYIGTVASGKKQDDGDGEVFDYYIDREAPVVKLSFEGDYHEDGKEFISSRTKVVLSATDDKSGVQKIMYSYNSFLTNEEYQESFRPQGNGNIKISSTATDWVENTAEEFDRHFFIDQIPPESKISFNGSVFRNRDTLFVSGQTMIEITAADKESGVKSINVIHNDVEHLYEKSFVAGNAGRNNIQWMAVDNVNNKENEHSLIFVVDEKPPSIHHHFSVEPIGEKVVRDEKYTIYPSNTKIYMGATDDVSGEESLQYFINGAKSAETIPVSNLEPGNYEIVIEAVDALNNKASKTLRFAVEK